jgi:hypothetical protein
VWFLTNAASDVALVDYNLHFVAIFAPYLTFFAPCVTLLENH